MPRTKKQQQPAPAAVCQNCEGTGTVFNTSSAKGNGFTSSACPVCRPAADAKPESFEDEVRTRAAQLPPPRENPPDAAVAAIRAQIDRWGAYWTIQAMLTAMREWSRTAPASSALDVAEHTRVNALRKVVSIG